MGPRLELQDYNRIVTGMRFVDATTVDVASRPNGADAAPHSLVERFEAGSGRRVLGPVTLGPPHASPLLGARDGRRVLTVAGSRLVVLDARTLAPVNHVDIRSRAANAIALGPDDRTVAVGGNDGSVRFVDLRTGAVREASGRHGGAVTGTQFTPDGRALVTTSDDGDAILWDVRAAAASETLHGHANGIAALQVTGDSRTLYTAGLDGAIFEWDLAGHAPARPPDRDRRSQPDRRAEPRRPAAGARPPERSGHRGRPRSARPPPDVRRRPRPR